MLICTPRTYITRNTEATEWEYFEITMIIKEIEVKDIMTKTNLPVSDYAVNPYVGCTHACKYCYASFMKRFTNHPEPWGEFIDVKSWPKINKPGKYVSKEALKHSKIVHGKHSPCMSRSTGLSRNRRPECRSGTAHKSLI